MSEPHKIYKVGLLGKGKLGSLVAKLLEKDVNIDFRQLNTYDIEGNDYNIDILVDISHADVTNKVLKYFDDNNIQMYGKYIIGTTGNLNQELIEKLHSTVVSNFGSGIPAIKKIFTGETINFNNFNYYTSGWTKTIEETHHVHKKDAPSGTAKTLADVLGIPYNKIISHREGEVFGEHKIILTNGLETIEIKHVAHSRDVFADGCKRMVNKLIKQLEDERLGVGLE